MADPAPRFHNEGQPGGPASRWPHDDDHRTKNAPPSRSSGVQAHRAERGGCGPMGRSDLRLRRRQPPQVQRLIPANRDLFSEIIRPDPYAAYGSASRCFRNPARRRAASDANRRLVHACRLVSTGDGIPQALSSRADVLRIDSPRLRRPCYRKIRPAFKIASPAKPPFSEAHPSNLL